MDVVGVVVIAKREPYRDGMLRQGWSVGVWYSGLPQHQSLFSKVFLAEVRPVDIVGIVVIA